MTLLTVVTFALLLSQAVSQFRRQSPDAVNFPPFSSLTFSSAVQPCPGHADFCSCQSDYPAGVRPQSGLAQTRLVRDKIFHSHITEDCLSTRGLTRGLPRDQGDKRACTVHRSVTYPQKARNIRGTFMFIMNQREFRQAVEVEQCVGEGQSCNTDNDAPSRGRTHCRQQYSTHRLYAINATGHQVYDSFSLPSACLCHHSSFRSSVSPRQFQLQTTQLPFCQAGISLEIGSRQRRRGGSRRRGDRPRRQGQRAVQACSSSSHYCEDSGDYPHSILSMIRGNSEVSGQLFKKVFDGACSNDINIRVFNSISEEQLCRGLKKVVFPRKALNMQKEWKFIVNIGEYTQSVEVEECQGFYSDAVGEFGSCLYSGSIGNNPRGTSCRQLHREHRLLAVNSQGLLEVDSFMLPSACACYLRDNQGFSIL